MQLVALEARSVEAMEVQADELLASTKAIFADADRWYLSNGGQYDRKGCITQFHGTADERKSFEEHIKAHARLEGKIHAFLKIYNELAAKCPACKEAHGAVNR